MLATANPDKAAELAALVAENAPGVELVARPSGLAEVEESGHSLVENARLKAAAVAATTGLPALADDTGLEVAALGGAPGIYAARYAGEGASYADNVTKLLTELARGGAVDPPARSARFVTVALLRFPDGGEVVGEGAVAGHIAPAPLGGLGFGYDPVFVPEEGDGRTFAELAAAEKHTLSHRARAVAALSGALRALVG